MPESSDLLNQKKISVKAAARLLGITPKYAYKLIHIEETERRLPCLKIGSIYKVPLDELRKYAWKHYNLEIPDSINFLSRKSSAT